MMSFAQMRFLSLHSLSCSSSAAAPAKASADWFFTPFVGWNFGG